MPESYPHKTHTDEYEEAHVTAAGAIIGARMAGKDIPPWSADMNEAFQAATAEAFDIGFRAGATSNEVVRGTESDLRPVTT